MDIVYEKVPDIKAFYDETKALTYQHWHECEIHGGEVDIDWMAYDVLQEAGQFHLYCVRIFGELIGYTGYLVSPSHHCRGQLFALNDLCYVVPKHRGRMYFVKLLKFAEKDLVGYGVNVIGHSVKIEHDFSPILERQGFVLEEHYFSKRIQ